ncbi:MAG: hypothetical protein Q9168_003540 [Polycauliona sp. 1 TL-2023]
MPHNKPKDKESTYDRNITYLESLSKLYKHYTISSSGAVLAPPELLTQITAQIEVLGEYRKASFLDPELSTIRRLMKVIKNLGCAHDSEEARETCGFKELHRLILRRVVQLKDLKFEQV